MTQTVAGEFADFKKTLKEFSQWLKNLKDGDDFADEIIQSQMETLISSISVQLAFYTEMDYKAKFLEWVQRKLVDLINENKRLKLDKKKYVIKYVRINLKNKFDHILVAYPFVTEDIEFINWKWTYREILMVLYSLKEFGAFKNETEDIDMSNLKDLIFRSGFFHHGRLDIENSYKDTITAWNRIKNRQKPSTELDVKGVPNDNSVMTSTENAGYECLKEFAKNLHRDMNQYDSENYP